MASGAPAADEAPVKVHRLAALARREEGIALVMAVVFTTVLMAIAVSLVYYSTAGVHSASNSSANQGAYRFAEAGINDAFAVIANSLDDTSKIAPQPAYAGDP